MFGFISDRFLAMNGKNEGVAAELKNKLKKFERSTCFLNLHYILYQEAMYAKL